MKKNIFILVAILSVSFVMMSCHDSSTSPTQSPAKTPPGRTITQSQTISSSNAFGLKLLSTLNTANKDSNVVISPLSVSMALGMTMNGAAGSTHDAMASVLGFAGMTDSSINQSYLGLINTLNALDPSTAFNLANSIWYRQSFSVEPSFLGLNESYFDAVVRPLNFNDPGAAGTINAWVDSATNGKIPSIIDPPISDSTMMFLINAVYFKGTWKSQFDSTQTTQEPFVNEENRALSVPMMYQQDTLLYYQNEKVQLVDMEYGNGDYRMAVILPAMGEDVNTLAASLTASDLQQWIAGLESANVWLSMPRFTAACNFNLNSVLSTMGMGVAFDRSKANFTGISSDPGLHIDKVTHKLFIKVGEMGTEAAAATAGYIIEPMIANIPPAGTFVMDVNRPFIFVIRDAISGAMLFVGKIVNPM